MRLQAYPNQATTVFKFPVAAAFRLPMGGAILSKCQNGALTSPACLAIVATWSGSFEPSTAERTAARTPCEPSKVGMCNAFSPKSRYARACRNRKLPANSTRKCLPICQLSVLPTREPVVGSLRLFRPPGL